MHSIFIQLIANKNMTILVFKKTGIKELEIAKLVQNPKSQIIFIYLYNLHIIQYINIF